MLLCGSILLSFGAPFSPLFLGSIKTHPSKGFERSWLHFSDVCLQFGLKFNKLSKNYKSYGSTEWKFQNFPATQILREINF